MLVIRLKPIGKKHQISYRVVVAERRSKLNGRFVEDLGFYNPQTKEFRLNAERIKYWRDNGAQVSDTVYNLMVKDGVINGPKRPVKMKPSKKAKEEKTEETTSEAPAAEEAAKEESPSEEKPAEEVKEEKPAEEEKKEEEPAEEKKEEAPAPEEKKEEESTD